MTSFLIFNLRKTYFSILLMIFILCSVQAVSDPLDTNQTYKIILKIEHLNDDSVKDTIIGYSDNSRVFLPKKIIWGKDTTENNIPDSLKKVESNINYPNWNLLGGSCSFDFVNSDTLIDIVLIIKGQLVIDSTNYKDTTTAIVIFGRRGLDTLSEFDLSIIDTFQTTPFISMKMRIGHEITDGAYRDYSSQASYVLKKIIITDTSLAPPIIITNKTEINTSEVKIYPNPAVYFTNVELNRIAPGSYQMSLITIDGRLVEEFRLETSEYGNITKIINFESYATGKYILNIKSLNSFNGTYYIIIIH